MDAYSGGKADYYYYCNSRLFTLSQNVFPTDCFLVAEAKPATNYPNHTLHQIIKISVTNDRQKDTVGTRTSYHEKDMT